MTKKRQLWGVWVNLLLLWMALATPGCSGPVNPERTIVGGWLAEHGGRSLLSKEAGAAMTRMRDIGVRWIAAGPEAWMPAIDKPQIDFGKDEKELRTYLRNAKSKGFEVMLLPRIESPAFFRPPYPFRADIAMKTQADWDKFYANYTKMMVYYAKIAEEEGVGILVLGLEYRKSVKRDPEAWRAIAKAVRGVFKGKITYSANWYKEYEEVTFWDALDFIGVGAYFEVAPEPLSTVATMTQQWVGVKNKLWRISTQYKRPVIFTELGYTTFVDAGRYPWKWQGDRGRPVSRQHQADCYEAFFRALLDEPWFRGFFIWRFYTYSLYVNPWEYSPENKPAEEVLRRWFSEP